MELLTLSPKATLSILFLIPEFIVNLSWYLGYSKYQIEMQIVMD